MNTIYKYPLRITDDQSIKMPEGAKILTAQMQGETLCLWAEVNPALPLERRFFEIIGTGNPLPSGMGASRTYINTVQSHGGQLVWHVYEYTEA